MVWPVLSRAYVIQTRVGRTVCPRQDDLLETQGCPMVVQWDGPVSSSHPDVPGGTQPEMRPSDL